MKKRRIGLNRAVLNFVLALLVLIFCISIGYLLASQTINVISGYSIAPNNVSDSYTTGSNAESNLSGNETNPTESNFTENISIPNIENETTINATLPAENITIPIENISIQENQTENLCRKQIDILQRVR